MPSFHDPLQVWWLSGHIAPRPHPTVAPEICGLSHRKTGKLWCKTWESQPEQGGQKASAWIYSGRTNWCFGLSPRCTVSDQNWIFVWRGWMIFRNNRCIYKLDTRWCKWWERIWIQHEMQRLFGQGWWIDISTTTKKQGIHIPRKKSQHTSNQSFVSWVIPSCWYDISLISDCRMNITNAFHLWGMW